MKKAKQVEKTNDKEKVNEPGKVKKVLKEIYPYIIIAALVVSVRLFIMAPVEINENSMNPTLENGQTILISKLTKNIERFDIIVFSYEDTHLIKRVIGLPGETVEYKDSYLYINGEAVEEVFITETTEDFDKVTLGENEYFVTGDNRDNSLDSRTFGAITKDKITGKAFFRMFPLKSFSKIN